MLVQFHYSTMHSQFSAPIEVYEGESLDSIKAKVFADYRRIWRHAPCDAYRCVTLWKEVKPPVYDDLYAVVEDAVQEKLDTQEKFNAALKTVQGFKVLFAPSQPRSRL